MNTYIQAADSQTQSEDVMQFVLLFWVGAFTWKKINAKYREPGAYCAIVFESGIETVVLGKAVKLLSAGCAIINILSDIKSLSDFVIWNLNNLADLKKWSLLCWNFYKYDYR